MNVYVHVFICDLILYIACHLPLTHLLGIIVQFNKFYSIHSRDRIVPCFQRENTGQPGWDGTFFLVPSRPGVPDFSIERFKLKFCAFLGLRIISYMYWPFKSVNDNVSLQSFLSVNQKVHSFCDFLFAYLEDKTLQNWVYL